MAWPGVALQGHGVLCHDTGVFCPLLVPDPLVEGGGGRVAVEGKGPQRWAQRRFDRRLEEVAEAVGGGYCRLPMPLRLALGVRGTAAGHGLDALKGVWHKAP